MGKDINKAFCIIQDTYNNNTKSFDENTLFTYVMDTVILALINYQNFQSKLNYIHSGEIDKHLFEFVDFSNFSDQLNEVNKKLEPNLFIPKIKSMGKNNFIKTHTVFNGTHLTLSIILPVLSRNLFELNEIIPIPFQDENSVFILDHEPTNFYIDGTKFLSFTANTKHNLCSEQDNLTICNTLLEEDVVALPNCLKNLLLLDWDRTCLYKQIAYKNYFIRISERKMFAFIVNPIQIVKQCTNENDEIFHLIKSREILLGNNCIIYKYIDTDQFENSKQTKSELEMPNEHLKYGKLPTHTPMSRLPILSRYEIQQTNVINTLGDVRIAIPMARERIDKITIKNPISEFFEGWNLTNWLIYGLIYFLGAILVIFTCYLIVKKIIQKLI